MDETWIFRAVQKDLLEVVLQRQCLFLIPLLQLRYTNKNAICKDASLGNYFISKDKYETLKGFEVFPNDIIVSCAGTIGESYVLPSNMRKGIINQALMKITLFDLRLLDFYLMYFDFKLKESAQEHGHGIALKTYLHLMF